MGPDRVSPGWRGPGAALGPAGRSARPAADDAAGGAVGRGRPRRAGGASSSPSSSAMAASASARRRAGGPPMKSRGPLDPRLHELGDEACGTARARRRRGRRPRRTGRTPGRPRAGRGSARPRGRARGGRPPATTKRGRQRRLELGPHGVQHLADQVVLRREVVHDDPVADAEPLGDAAEGELAQPVVERRRQCAVEDLRLGVLVAHQPLIVVVTAIMVSQ